MNAQALRDIALLIEEIQNAMTELYLVLDPKDRTMANLVWAKNQKLWEECHALARELEKV